MSISSGILNIPTEDDRTADAVTVENLIIQMKQKSVITILIIFLLGLICTSAFAQLLPTNLVVTVLNVDGSSISNAEVTIYANEADYRNSTNGIATVTTDKKGKAKFKKLKPDTIYFIEATFEGQKNDGRGAQTAPLVKGRLNKVNVVI